MLRFKLKERTADKEFRERRHITILEVAEATGITRNTLSKMLNQHGSSVRSENLDRLCAYFKCRIEDLVEYVAADSRIGASRKPGGPTRQPVARPSKRSIETAPPRRRVRAS